MTGRGTRIETIAAAVIATRVLRVKFTFEWMAGLLVFAIWGAGKMMDRLLRKE
jgi:hypothetical protein